MSEVLLRAWDDTAKEWKKVELDDEGRLKTTAMAAHKITDDDADTKVDVEESADEDTVRMDVGGVEAFLLSTLGILTYAKQSACAVGKDSAQVIGTGSSTKIQYNKEVYDIQGEFDPVTDYDFTVTEAGIYLVFASTRLIDLGAGKLVSIKINKDAVILVDHFLVAPVAHSMSIFVITIAQLAVDDKVTAEVYHDHGANRSLDVGVDSNNAFVVVKLA